MVMMIDLWPATLPADSCHLEIGSLQLFGCQELAQKWLNGAEQGAEV